MCFKFNYLFLIMSILILILIVYHILLCKEKWSYIGQVLVFSYGYQINKDIEGFRPIQFDTFHFMHQRTNCLTLTLYMELQWWCLKVILRQILETYLCLIFHRIFWWCKTIFLQKNLNYLKFVRQWSQTTEFLSSDLLLPPSVCSSIGTWHWFEIMNFLYRTILIIK